METVVKKPRLMPKELYEGTFNGFEVKKANIRVFNALRDEFNKHSSKPYGSTWEYFGYSFLFPTQKMARYAYDYVNGEFASKFHDEFKTHKVVATRVSKKCLVLNVHVVREDQDVEEV